MATYSSSAHPTKQKIHSGETKSVLKRHISCLALKNRECLPFYMDMKHGL